jgi:hypothetical protein
MPTPRAHGGAALVHIPMNTPGFRGLNAQQSSGLLGPEWATTLSNAVIDDNGRVAARNGYDNLTTTSIVGMFQQVAEYVKSDGSTEIVAIGATTPAIYRSLDDGSTFASVTGTATPSAEPASIHNFNNQCWVFQKAEAPAYYSGTTFTTVADVNAPQSDIALAAFGRLWAADADGHSLSYSALLDGTNWTTAGAGFVDMWNIWPGNDTITAITQFNGALVIFGKRCVVVWSDGAGSQLGIDPLTMYVVDIISGTGCLSYNSIQHVDGDLWFLSENGLQSLGRVIQEKSNPLNNLSKNVQDYLQASVDAATLAKLRSVYSPRDRVYLLSLPSGTVPETGRCFAFDTRGRMEDGAARCTGTWTLVPTAACVRRNGTLLLQIANANARVGAYTGALDDSAAYVFEYNSGWLDLTKEGYLIFPKKYTGLFFTDNSIDITFSWAFDFRQTYVTETKTFTGAAGGGEWGSAEWGTSEFGGGVNLREGGVAGSRSGEYIKIGISASINNTILAVQQLDLFCKVGRMKHE